MCKRLFSVRNYEIVTFIWPLNGLCFVLVLQKVFFNWNLLISDQCDHILHRYDFLDTFGPLGTLCLRESRVRIRSPHRNLTKFILVWLFFKKRYSSTSGLLSFKKPETVLWTIAKHYLLLLMVTVTNNIVYKKSAQYGGRG